MSGESKPGLADILPDLSTQLGQSLCAKTGRDIRLVSIALDASSGDIDLAVGAFNIDQELLLMMLAATLGQIQAGNAVTSVRIYGEEVARYEGKPS